MTDRPIFSVITPTYNRERKVCSAVESLMRQTLVDFEQIVADDGSTDGTQSLLSRTFPDEIASGRLKLLALKHGGVCAARNAALSVARGEWIAYLDSDNIVTPDFLQTFADGIAANPDARNFYAALVRRKARTILDRPFDRRRLVRGNYIDIGVYCHHRDLIGEFGLFDGDVAGLEDWDLIARHTRKYMPVRLGKVVLAYNDGLSNDRLSLDYGTKAVSYENFRNKHDPDTCASEADLEIIRNSWFFDSEWYKAQYGKLIGGRDPAMHYLVRGWKNDLHPGPQFDGIQYLARNPDVAQLYTNPLLHYERSGRKEGRIGFLRTKPLSPQ